MKAVYEKTFERCYVFNNILIDINDSLYLIQPSNTTSNIYLIINEWATSFGH